MNRIEVESFYTAYLGHCKVAGDQLLFKCWRCDQDEGSWHFYVNPDTGVYYCHKCASNPDGYGVGNMVSFKKLHGEAEVKIVSTPTTAYQFITDYKVASEVYTWLINNLSLEEVHSTYLYNRGVVNPDKYRLVSSNGAIDKLRSHFDEEKLVLSGLFYKNKLNFLVSHESIADDRIIIPYMNGKVVSFIRSRGNSGKKYTSPMGISAKYNYWGEIKRENRSLIITEGELKAIVATEKGYRCIGLPGMNSSYDVVVRDCDCFDVNEIYICFDSQVNGQNNVDHAARKLAKKLIKEGRRIFIVVLPLLGEEKMDLDSYLLREGSINLALGIEV